MITNDMRREVARRFRDIGIELGTRTPLWWHTAKALGVRTCVGGRTAFCMLADLIDPPDGGLVADDNLRLIDRCRELECELARVKAELGKLEGDTSRTCRDNVACDRDALLELAKSVDAMLASPMCMLGISCADCDADDDPDDLTACFRKCAAETARRIREANGE